MYFLFSFIIIAKFCILSIKIANLSVRSLIAHFPSFLYIDEGIDIMIVTETWLDPHFDFDQSLLVVVV